MDEERIEGMAGWIKLHRKILNNPVFLNPELFQLFNYCVLMANHIEKKIIMNGGEVIIERGSFVTGRKIIAEDTGQTESSIYKRLKVLEKLLMISVKSNNRFSTVKVLNYELYQGADNDEEQQSNNKVTTKEQQSNTTKKGNNAKKVSTPLHDVNFDSFWSIYPNKKAKVDAQKKWDLLIKNGVDPEKIIAASIVYAAERKGQEPKYTKHAATFLGPGKHYEEYFIKAQPDKKTDTERNWNKMTKEEQDNWVS